jgi:4-amino-4-deoxy-L-arabinose transferase-like glycosyltransferase
LPNLVFAYAGAQRLSGDLVVGAKILSVLATTAVIAMLFVAASQETNSGSWKRWAVASTVALILLVDPLFCTATGKTWNHEVPTAMTLGAILLLARAHRTDRISWTITAGVCAGLAVGCRLTFAPVLVAMAGSTLLMRCAFRRQIVHTVWFTAASSFALAPSIWYLCAVPEAFVFGNFEFPRLRLADPSNLRVQKTATIIRKLRFLLQGVVLPSWPLFLAYAAFGARPGWMWLRRREPQLATAGLLLLVAPFLLLGCFTPVRYQYQHYYVLLPVLAAAVAVGFSRRVPWRWGEHSAWAALVVLAAVGAFRGAKEYSSIAKLTKPPQWFSARCKRKPSLSAAVGGGKVLTLAPAVPLAAGATIYPEFATGPFAWRTAHLVPSERRRRLHLIAPEDLAEFLAKDPPAGIVVGYEEEALEKPFLDYAQQHGYKRRTLAKGRHLWTAPVP